MATSPGAANLVRGDDLKDFIAAGWREHSVSPDVAPWRLPRWQSSTATISGGELIPAVSNAQAESLDRDEHFEQRKAEWERDQSIEVAAELVGSAIVLGRTGEVVPAARLLADPGSDATATLREMALHALGESPAQPSPTRPTHRGRLE